jgi:23S rRNA (cytosine1962-C5)-methyltransferase
MKVIRRLPSLLRPNGYALLCLNAPELSTEFLLEQVSEGVPNYELCFVERLENPPAFASACSERALKVLVFQYRPCDNSEQEIEHQ